MPKKILVLGAGSGGTKFANLVAQHLSKEIGQGKVSVRLVGERAEHVFQPANLDIAFRGSDPKKALRTEADLINRNVLHTLDGAANISLEERKITLRTKGGLDYDYLVLAPGAVASPETMPGLKEGSLNFHSEPFEAAKIWNAIQSVKKGKILIAIASVPHKCPPSPNEAAFLVDEFLRKRGLRDSVEIKLLTPYPRAYPSQAISDVIQPIFEERGIEVIPFFNADYVDPNAKKIYNMEGESYDYDLLLAVPPHLGAEVVRSSAIGDEEGWIPSDRNTMRMKGHSDVFAIGDATNIPISKSGVVAHLQAVAVAKDIVSEVAGVREIQSYNGRINCPMETGSRRALFVSATYDAPPKRQNPTLLRYIMKK